GHVELPPRGASADPLADWAERTAQQVGIPARALIAYGNAELALRQYQPGCRISWATLAGIGRIESDHGRYGGAVLGEDGRPSTPIIGVALNGSRGVKAISDTDGGALDGDTTHDRAVGPMQFIPGTWARYASDGNGDGLADPQQIDDAALAAARYLCVGDRDMASADGWWTGIMSYNNSVEYAQKVFGLADTYARQAHTAAD
ncbi:lytic transglycosylase domain-containing protein, partial [Prauserella oleivorans]